MNIEKYCLGVFTVDAFISRDECQTLILNSEKSIYEKATIQAINGPKLDEIIRYNDRVIFDDHDFANNLFERARIFLPKVINGCSLSGFNERFRFYRYTGSQFFDWHSDGSHVRTDKEESLLTFIVYLSADFDDGYTQFAWDKVYPKVGMALVFPHNLKHRAVPAKNGIKYVLRTDVMYVDQT